MYRVKDEEKHDKIDGNLTHAKCNLRLYDIKENYVTENEIAKINNCSTIEELYILRC